MTFNLDYKNLFSINKLIVLKLPTDNTGVLDELNSISPINRSTFWKD